AQPRVASPERRVAPCVLTLKIELQSSFHLTTGPPRQSTQIIPEFTPAAGCRNRLHGNKERSSGRAAIGAPEPGRLRPVRKPGSAPASVRQPKWGPPCGS